MKLLIAAARQLGIGVATVVDRWIGWHRFPPPLGLMLLIGIRSRLRDKNLVHTSLGLPPRKSAAAPPACRRTPDGTFNDLQYPSMGAAGAPLGRNVPLEAVRPERFGAEGTATSLPSPRTVSNELLARKEFVSAGALNVLAAAWIQFMVHDWFSHGPTPAPGTSEEIEIPLDEADEWRRTHGAMRIPRAAGDLMRPPCAHAAPLTFPNHVTHWWDASQLYGSSHETLERVRATARHGKIQMDRDPRLLPLDPAKQEHPYDRADLTGFNENWWVGLSLLHTLFAREHNAICDHLRTLHPEWTDEDLFAHARLINAAVIAKIHVVEWTPAILDNPTVAIGMRGSWFGLLKEGGIYKYLGYLFSPEARDGIRHSPTDQHGTPYSITEEFVAVYRMHALLPDDLRLRSVSGRRETIVPLAEAVFGHARDVVATRGFTMDDVAFSLGTQAAGAITLHNYPRTLRELRLPNGQVLDLAAVDVLRDRERGVPRYNEFRRLVGRPAVTSFGQLVGPEGRAKKWDRELQRVYGDVERVDLMVGLFAEPKPPGFGFSDTAFRIFLLMAGRRLKSDRFFTTDFTEEVYSKEGIAWVETRTMAQILADHLPELKTHVAILKNPFHLWNALANRT